MKKNTLLKLVGANIRDARKKKGLTQEELAEKADINPKFLGKVERAETNVSVVTLSKICDALGISLSGLLSFTAMDKKFQKLGELSSELWGLMVQKDPETIKRSIAAFKSILEGAEKLTKGKS